MSGCRTCLRRDHISGPAFDLFGGGSNVKLLSDSAGLTFSRGDGLPAHMCSDCYGKLSGFQTLCAQAIEADRVYRSQFNVKSEQQADTSSKNDAQCSSAYIKNEVDPVTVVAAILDVKQELQNNQHCKDKVAAGKVDINDDDDDEDNGHNNDDNRIADDNTADSDSSEYKPPSAKPRNRKKNAGKGAAATTTTAKSKIKQKRRPIDRTHSYYCDTCGKRYHMKALLAGHLRKHIGLVPFVCDQCPRTFQRHDNMLTHQKQRHTADIPTPCRHDGCTKMFKQPHLERNHYERMHLGMHQKRIATCICEECGKAFDTRSSLAQHRKWHTSVDQYPYQCEFCEKRFLAKSGYELHVLRHKNIRNFPCPQCPSRMVSKLELRYHMQMHDEKHKCAECPQAFTSKILLHQHELIVHRGHVAYVCRFCQRQFTKKISLVSHERNHTGEKPFPCTMCDEHFGNVRQLQSHVRFIHST